MSEEKDEPLNESDLDGNVTKPDGDEVKKGRHLLTPPYRFAMRMGHPIMFREDERNDEEQRHGDGRNHDQHQQARHSHVDLPVDALLGAGAEDLARLESEK